MLLIRTFFISGDWTFDNTFLFMGSVATTIGYGRIVPKTPEGKLLCICFTIIAGFHPKFYGKKSFKSCLVPLFAILLQYISLYIEELLIVLIPRANKFFGRNLMGPYGITSLYFIFGCVCFLMIPSYIFQYVEG